MVFEGQSNLFEAHQRIARVCSRGQKPRAVLREIDFVLRVFQYVGLDGRNVGDERGLCWCWRSVSGGSLIAGSDEIWR